MNMGLVYIGTYTEGRGGGIHTLRFDTDTGALSRAFPPVEAQNPSWLALSPDGGHLYAAIETDAFEGGPGGAVASFSVDGDTGELKPAGMQPTEGRAPCHVATDGRGRFLFAANYGEGTVTQFPLEAGGGIAPLSRVLRHKGSGPDKKRQGGPHAHCAAFAPDGKHLFAVDLGCDSVFVYPFDPETGVAARPEYAMKLRPGSGPRHIAFHPSGRFAYVVTELSNEVAAFAYSPEDGVRELQYVSALPEGFVGKSWCAAIHIAPDGSALYASNREHDSIAVFRIDETGRLEQLQAAPTLGRWPRDFAIAPGGKWLLAANQKSNGVVVFRIEKDGRIGEAVGKLRVEKPVCVRFA